MKLSCHLLSYVDADPSFAALRSCCLSQIGTPAVVDPPAPVLVPVVGARHFTRVLLGRSGELDLGTAVTVVETRQG